MASGQKVENQPFDEALDVNDSEEIESDEDEDGGVNVRQDQMVQESA